MGSLELSYRFGNPAAILYDRSPIVGKDDLDAILVADVVTRSRRLDACMFSFSIHTLLYANSPSISFK